MPAIPAPLTLYHIAAIVLLGMGLLGLTLRRTLIGMLISVELMLNGAGLSIAAAAGLTPANTAMGQSATLLVMGLAAAEATLIVAIVIIVHRRFGSTRTAEIQTLQE